MGQRSTCRGRGILWRPPAQVIYNADNNSHPTRTWLSAFPYVTVRSPQTSTWRAPAARVAMPTAPHDPPSIASLPLWRDVVAVAPTACSRKMLELYDYLPSLHWYQIILPGNRGTRVWTTRPWSLPESAICVSRYRNDDDDDDVIMSRCHYDLQKYSFTVRIVNLPNSLPENISANTVNTLKNRPDKFWSDQELVYDYKADLTGIGNRSLISLDDTSAL